MNTKPALNPDQLARIGRALYGERWQTSLAADLNVADRTMRRWLVGEFAIPDGVEIELRKLLIKRVNEIGGIIQYSVNPSDRSVHHYPTGAYFRYDDAGILTLLNPRMIDPDDIALITQGAEECLRQEHERDPRIRLIWLDQTGKGNSSMEIIQEKYKGYVISYPRIPVLGGMWTVNLASEFPQSQARLGPSAKVFNDNHSLGRAVAQAKRYVDGLQ